jgi:Family of unknown function (DUF6364)
MLSPRNEAAGDKNSTDTYIDDVISQAQAYAEARRDSLSGLVEKALQHLTQTQETPFSKRWRGKYKASRQASTRYKALAGVICDRAQAHKVTANEGVME